MEEEKLNEEIRPTDPILEKLQRRKRILKTILINLSYLSTIGILEGLRGPTLLDLKDIYETQIEVISFMYLTQSTGSLAGSFFAGYIMDKFPRRKNLIMFVYHFLVGILTMLVPLMRNTYALFALTFANGLNVAGIEVGGNVLCLDIWRGLDGGPSVNSIHFSFAVGAFIAPLITAPFLSTRATIIHQLEANGTNQTVIDDILEGLGDSTDTQIVLLYILAGVVTVLISLGFLYFEFDSVKMRQERKRLTREQSVIVKDDPVDQKWTANIILLTVVIFIFYFFYNGSEVTFGIYLTAFALQCRLQVTAVQGAMLTAVFWGAFALMRFFAIFVAMLINPLVAVTFSFVLCLASCASMVLFAEHSFLALQVCVAALGIGMGPIYAGGLLWLERRIVITSKIGAVINIASSFGSQVFPITVGQYISDWPMFLMYQTLGVVVVSFSFFLLAVYVGQVVMRDKKENVTASE